MNATIAAEHDLSSAAEFARTTWRIASAPAHVSSGSHRSSPSTACSPQPAASRSRRPLRFRINLLDGRWSPISGHWSLDYAHATPSVRQSA